MAVGGGRHPTGFPKWLGGLLRHVQGFLAPGTPDLASLVVGGDLELEATGASQEGKAVDLTHDVTDLAKLFTGALCGLGFGGAGFTQGDLFRAQGRVGQGSGRARDLLEGLGVVDVGTAGHLAEDLNAFLDGGMGAGQVREFGAALAFERIGDGRFGDGEV